MTLIETTKLMKLLQTAYPQFYAHTDEVTRKNAVKIWQLALQDMDYALAQKAFVQLIKTCKFPPTAADFHLAAKQVLQQEQDTVAKMRTTVPTLHR